MEADLRYTSLGAAFTEKLYLVGRQENVFEEVVRLSRLAGR